MKTEREFFDPSPLPWRPAPGFPPGVWEQVISGGRDEGATTRLLRFDPGSGNDRVVTHDFWLYLTRHRGSQPQELLDLPHILP